MSDTVDILTDLDAEGVGFTPTPGWPQVWVGTPTSEYEAGGAWGQGLPGDESVTGTWTRWSEDAEIEYHDPRFVELFEVDVVPAAAIQVAGVRSR